MPLQGLRATGVLLGAGVETERVRLGHPFRLDPIRPRILKWVVTWVPFKERGYGWLPLFAERRSSAYWS